MANTLTNLIPDLHEALDVCVARTGRHDPAVRRDTNVARAAVNENVYIPITPAASSAQHPGVNAPDTGDRTIGNTSVTISKSKHVPVRWNGEETKGLNNSGLFSSIGRPLRAGDAHAGQRNRSRPVGRCLRQGIARLRHCRDRSVRDRWRFQRLCRNREDPRLQRLPDHRPPACAGSRCHCQPARQAVDPFSRPTRPVRATCCATA